LDIVALNCRSEKLSIEPEGKFIDEFYCVASVCRGVIGILVFWFDEGEVRDEEGFSHCEIRVFEGCNGD
jgi:hypothetical protein